jgi:hypothetical protein
MLYEAAWHARISRVFSGALRVWGVAGTVSGDPGDANAFIIAPAAGPRIRIRHQATAGWELTLRDARTSAEMPLGRHAGLPGLLRRLRSELAPDAPAGRLIVAAQRLPGAGQ